MKNQCTTPLKRAISTMAIGDQIVVKDGDYTKYDIHDAAESCDAQIFVITRRKTHTITVTIAGEPDVRPLPAGAVAIEIHRAGTRAPGTPATPKSQQLRTYAIYRGDYLCPTLAGRIESRREIDPRMLSTIDEDGMICDEPCLGMDHAFGMTLNRMDLWDVAVWVVLEQES